MPTGGTSDRFRPDVQGLRAVAVVAVVLFHAGLGFPGGFTGVDVFFVISGFVITGMLDAEHGRTGGLALGRFYLRRIRRLLPALALLLAFVLVTSPLLGPMSTGGPTVATGRAGALFTANLQLLRSAQGYFDPSAEANPLLHLWTLSVEEQFYLGFPALLLAGWWIGRRAGRPRLGAAAAVVAVAALSFGLAFALTHGLVPGIRDSGSRIAFYASPVRAWEFLAGALLALVGRRVRLRGAASQAVAGGAALALAAGFLAVDAASSFPLVAGVVPVVGALLAIAAGAPTVDGGARTNPLTALLSTGPLRWLGDRSYAWYLWHWPAIVFARSLFPGRGWAAPAAAALSLLPAWASYELVEQPIRRRSDRPARVTLALGAACVVVPLVLAMLTLPIGRRLDHGEVAAFRHALRPHADLTRGCTITGSAVRTDVRRCTWPAAAPAAGRAVLLGDSNAGHVTEPFVAAANGLGLDALVQTRPRCPFVDLTLRKDGVVDRNCRRTYETQLADLLAHPPAVAVLSDAADLELARAEVAVSSDGRAFVAATGPKRAAWRAAMARTVDRLRDAGIAVVLVDPVPRFTGWQAPGECARLRVRLDAAACGTTRATADARRPNRPLAEIHREVAAPDVGVVVVDPAPVLCPAARCSTNQDGTWVWKDETHVSVDGALRLTPALTAGLRQVLAAPSRPG